MKVRIGNFLERHRAAAIVGVFFLLFVNAGAHYYSYRDRAEIHGLVDARAKIGMVVICHNWNWFSEAERQIVISNWKEARYPGEPCEEK